MNNVAASAILPFPEQGAASWIHTYRGEVLEARDEATIEAYTRAAIEGFLDTLPSFSYKKQARAALSGFCRWLHEDQQLLSRNPVRGVSIPAQALLAPRELSKDQRYVIRDLVEREADLRGKVAFALGYFAGCRVSDVSWLLLDSTHVSRKAGWITVGHKGGKERTIDLVNEARSPLYDYLHQGERKESAYVFTRKPREKAHERGRDRCLALDRGWRPPMVAAPQNAGALLRSEVLQRDRFS